MLIRLISSGQHAHILYTLSFPTNLRDLPISPAWSSQLHLLTAVLHFEPPQSIHVFDRSVGLVARIHDLTFDVPAKEVIVNFIDGRTVTSPMNAHCIQMLHSVAEDVQVCSEQEARRNNSEEACTSSICSSVASLQDIPIISSVPQKSPKLSRHKRQRSLLFSLISALVPRSLSPPPAPPPSPTTSTPPPTVPLPQIPNIAPRNTTLPSIPQSPVTPCHPSASLVTDPSVLRCRARATLMDVWRRHVVSALSTHNPYAGYTEWVLRGYGARVHGQVRDIERSLRRGAARGRARMQTDRRVALDYSQRSSEDSQRRWRPPSPFPVEDESEHDDCVVYPRNQQANEWNIRHVHNSSLGDDLDAYAFEFNEENDSILRESFGFGADVYGDEWDGDDHIAFDEFGALESNTEFAFDNRQLGFDEDLGNGEGEDYLTNEAFAATPSDATEGNDSDESQSSLHTPEDGELPSLPLSATLSGSFENGTCFQHRNHFDPGPTVVSKATSSRPKTRPPQLSHCSPKSPQKSSCSPFSPPRTPKRKPFPNLEEMLTTRVDLLSRIRSALTLVRARAHEERWGSIRSQNPFGCGLLDPDSERLLETRARRRAWSAGIKISAASTPGSGPWNESVLSVSHFSPQGPPGLAPPVSQVNRPIIPTGLLLGRPARRSPLGMYVWSAEDVANSNAAHGGKYGSIGLRLGEGMMVPKRPTRVSFLDSPTKLFPVREEGDDEQGSLRTSSSKIDFPQSPTSPTSPTSNGNIPSVPAMSDGLCDNGGNANTAEDDDQDDPFFCSPFQIRTRTTSMYGCSQSALSSQVLPMFRPRTPPPSYQAAVGDGETIAEEESDTGALDACALLCQPLSTLRLVSPTPTRPSLVPSPPFAPRVRARSLPTGQSDSLSSSLSSASKDEDCQDLSRAYAAPPPPAAPITAPPAIASTEPGLTYAHLHAAVPICVKSGVAKSLKGKEIASQEVVFERNGEEYTFGLEVALGRSDEGHSMW